MDAASLFVQPKHLLHSGMAPVASMNAELACHDKRTETKVPLEQNNHNMSGVLTYLDMEFGKYKYTVYRCASKFVALQRIFHTSKIPYKLVVAVMERHGMYSSGDHNMMVPPFQLTSLLHDLYFACEKLGHFCKNNEFKLDKATSLLANFFWNNFDPHRRHSISLLELKVTFILLCKLYSSDQLVTEFYTLLSNAKTKCVSKFNFEYFLNILSKLLTYIGEGKAYGAHNQQQIMEQAYARVHNDSSGLTEIQFHCLWSNAQTRFLIYANLLSLMKRIEDTAHLIHTNPCASCRLEHIIGIRFKCQMCRDLSLCLKCFACGYTTNKHITAHRMCEVFAEDQPPKKFTHYLARLCTFFGAGYGHKTNRGAAEEETKGFCNAQETIKGVSGETEMVNIPAESRIVRAPPHKVSTNNINAMVVAAQQSHNAQQQQQQQELSSLTGLTTTATNASERLQIIIDRLLQQNAKLEAQLQTVATATRDEISLFLNAHQNFLVEIINEMRNLSHSSTTTPITMSAYLTCSTPHRTAMENQSLTSYQPPAIKSGNYNENMAATAGGGGDGAAAATCGANLTHSLNGADLNRSYLEANKSDYSLNDLSLWFDQRKLSMHNGNSSTAVVPTLKALPESEVLCGADGFDVRDSDMLNFKLLLHKVKEIVDDSYSDNAELSAATQNLENVLDSIIKGEEEQRQRSIIST